VEHDAWELTSRGVALGTLGRLDEERESYEEAIRVKPDYVPAWFNLAAVLGELGRPREAIEYADLALHLNPRSVPALINRGLALHALNRPEEALACFDTAAHLQPRDPAIWTGRAMVLLGQGNVGGARAALRQLYRLYPEGGTTFPSIGTPNSIMSFDPSPAGIGPSSGPSAPTVVPATNGTGHAPTIAWVRRTEDTSADSARIR
jgi:tetratricopeptide (TPR) repeat protein